MRAAFGSCTPFAECRPDSCWPPRSDLTAHLAAKLAFPYALAVGFEVSLAMLLGLVVVNAGGVTAQAVPGVRFAVKWILGIGIILLGLRLNLGSIAAIGSEAFWLVLVTIGGACAFATVAGRRLGVPARVAVLVGIGASVCGNSAVAAAGPVVRAHEREVAFAVATITVFGTASVFLLPLIGRALDLDALAFGLWAGASVPDTAQTIATSAAYSTVGRDVATVVKLLRILLLAPLLLLLVWGWGRREAGSSAEAAKRSARKAVPFFLVGFVALAVVRSAHLVDPEVVADVDVVTRACFLVALAGLGLQTRMANIRVLGPRPFLLGLGTWGLMTASSLALILAFGLGPTRTSVAAPTDPRAFHAQHATASVPEFKLTGRLLATGIPGAGALSPVGSFHAGGPIHDKREFAAMTRDGAILDPDRLLVASTSNFGAPRALAGIATGSVLSLATDARAPLNVPPRFAAAGDGQARALGGAVQTFSAQSPAFVNRLTSPDAATADLPPVSNPTGISVNNAFGRPWLSNATGGRGGLESVVDPDGRPLADAPSERAGGVFAGSITDRGPQRVRGSLRAGALGNALLGASPDASGRAVFAVATADGAVAQIHVEDGVDRLAPPGTIAPVKGWRVGMAFNWVPDRFLYVTDPARDALVQLRLDDDFHVFDVAAVRRLRSAHFDEPVDLAPAVPEIANPAFSSNTTLAGGSDLYVANRGSGAIVRLRQDGRIRAVARIALPGRGRVRAGELNGIAVSPDTRTIWLAVGDAIVEVAAFGAPGGSI